MARSNNWLGQPPRTLSLPTELQAALLSLSFSEDPTLIQPLKLRTQARVLPSHHLR